MGSTSEAAVQAALKPAFDRNFTSHVSLAEIQIFTFWCDIFSHCSSQIKKNYVRNSIFRSGNACYHSVQNLLSSRLLPKNLKIKIYRTIILPAVLYGCETWSLTLREERKLRVFENMVLRRTRRDEVTRGMEEIA